MNQEAKPTYRPLQNDGAPYKCPDCGERKHASLFWYITTPNGHKGIICKDCVDSDWIAQAEYVKQAI